MQEQDLRHVEIKVVSAVSAETQNHIKTTFVFTPCHAWSIAKHEDGELSGSYSMMIQILRQLKNTFYVFFAIFPFQFF